ncbi:MAG: carboxylesterase family protein, partial [Bacteroidia bacterium]|nr:carboxylesterase family protein [Bacteroidia bacterium]
CSASARYVSDQFALVGRTTAIYAVANNYLGLPQWLELDVYTPTFDQAVNRPCIIYMHGGAFLTGDKRMTDAVDFCHYFARKGYVTVSIGYRLGALNPTKSEDMIRAVIRALQDARGAVQFMKKRAAHFRINPDKIFFAGYSAGAVTALHLAYLNRLEEFAQIADPAILNQMGGINAASGNYVGANWKVAGIIAYSGAIARRDWIESGDAPVLAIHGALDDVVPYNTDEPLFGVVQPPLVMDGSGKYIHAAREVGVCADLLTFLNEGHLYPYNPVRAGQAYDFIRHRLCRWVYGVPCSAGNHVVGDQNIGWGGRIGRNDEPSVLIYPNPTSGSFTVSLPSVGAAVVRLMDLSGRIVVEKSVDSDVPTQIPLPESAKGIYVVEAVGGGRVWREKLRIE